MGIDNTDLIIASMLGGIAFCISFYVLIDNLMFKKVVANELDRMSWKETIYRSEIAREINELKCNVLTRKCNCIIPDWNNYDSAYPPEDGVYRVIMRCGDGFIRDDEIYYNMENGWVTGNSVLFWKKPNF
jgi:hypothetical protein